MSQMHEVGPQGVILLNLNWGYQNQNTVYALLRRGVIRRCADSRYAYYHTDWKPVYPEEK